MTTIILGCATNKKTTWDESQVIFDLIEKHNWAAVTERVKTVPSDAFVSYRGSVSMVGGNANMAMHEACKHQPPVKVIEALLEANPDAVKTKGQWGYLPLHYASTSGASLAAVTMLIEAFPSGTRMRGEHDDLLPLHLATKWGASEDVLMAILTHYPEGIYVRDASGKTPMDYALKLSAPHIREHVVRTLEWGSVFCNVSKAAQQRVAHEIDCQLRGMSDAHSIHVAKLDAKYRGEIDESRSVIANLQAQLEAEKAKNQILAPFQPKCYELETKVDHLETEIKEKNSCIENFAGMISNLKSTKDTLESYLASEKETVKHLSETVTHLKQKVEDYRVKIAEQETLLAEKETVIQDLEACLEMHEKAQRSLANQAVNLENIRQEILEELKLVRAQRDKIRMEVSTITRKLETANNIIRSYEGRMETIQKWVICMGFSMQTWTVENDWIQNYAGSDDVLNSMAAANPGPPSDSAVARTDLAMGESDAKKETDFGGETSAFGVPPAKHQDEEEAIKEKMDDLSVLTSPSTIESLSEQETGDEEEHDSGAEIETGKKENEVVAH